MVFISHRQVDKDAAVLLSQILKDKGVQSWVDVLDPPKNNIDITKHIMSNLNRCSHVIVLFTFNTAGSMWVPFELGAAYKGEKGIATYLLNNVETPGYLDAFPRMKNSQDLNSFAAEYLQDQKITKSRSINESYNLSQSATAGTADAFIQRMKSRLGQ